MNIRPITSTPNAVAFAGTKTKKIEREVTTPTGEAADRAALKKLLRLKEKQIVSATINTNDNLVALELSTHGRNKISFLKIPFVDIFGVNSPPVYIDYVTRRTKSGSRISERHAIHLPSRNAQTKAVAKDVLKHLVRTVWKWMDKH